ncbi:MAG TPA: SDR family NAD(P)-dependent oxidoreductase [Spirochaetia bacterium]|nr:SDR family NAD(P)-dependent oxidoreductase [Spirochaetia bacterium]
MMVQSKGRVLVTGISRGIGKAIAQALSQDGWHVIGTSRDPTAVPDAQRLPGVEYLPLDLCQERSITDLANQVGAVDVLVSNGGASMISPAEETPLNKVRDLFEADFFGPVLLTQALLPDMRRREGGRLIYIGSMRGEAPSPFSAFYSAAKAALRSFAQCLRMEVRRYGLRVSVIAPWHIRTALALEKLHADTSAYAEAVDRVRKKRDEGIAEASDPVVVARLVQRILASRRPRAFYSVGRMGRSQAFLVKHLPRSLVEAMSRRRFEPKG